MRISPTDREPLAPPVARRDTEISLQDDAADGQLRFCLTARQPVPLRRMLFALQSMDLEVLHEQTSTELLADGTARHRHYLTLQAGQDTVVPIGRRKSRTHQRIRDTFDAIWSGYAEADNLNALVISADLSWQQVSILRSYARYLRQLPLPYGQQKIARILLDHAAATRALVALFEARFGGSQPEDDADRAAAIATAGGTLTDQIDTVLHIDADRVLRAFANLIGATVRTNAFATDALTAGAPYLVHKYQAADIELLPHPRPESEIFVYSPEFEGVHLRFGLVARGGLRWSDRHDDYRTEVLGLVRAQSVKNAMIVPHGAKGVFVVKTPAAEASTVRTPQEQAKHCYEHFVAALLDVVDDSAAATSEPRRAGVRHDQTDHYLVVAADKGTATFSDTANAVATRRGYWLGDAFASGGSAGYDHKAIGITARGAWVSGDSHLRELGVDSQADPFSVVGIGDMSGDVFGNGMLLRPTLRLVAAFDHRHIFIDPDPTVTEAYGERRRLFELPQSTWADYNPSVISPGGGVWPRTAKAVPVSAQVRAALGLHDACAVATPDELIRHILRAPVDVVFNGGIGTYIKATGESHADVADKVNDTVRIDAAEIRARLVIEGGNLGLTQPARIEFARRGGLINTDAIDNAAGVDCSDHEVNIKILLQVAGLNEPDLRQELLTAMTDDVAAHVLVNNRDHNRLLSDAVSNAAQMAHVHQRMISALHDEQRLHRVRENLPSEADFATMISTGAGLSRPQLATLLAHTKLALKADLLDGDDFDDPYFAEILARYFPAALRQAAGPAVSTHPLRREIIATAVVNAMLASSGLTYAFRIAEEIGATTSDIVRAHAIVSAVFELPRLWSDIHEARLDPPLTNLLVIESRRLLDRASRWFLVNRPQPLDVESEIDRFAQPVTTLRPRVAGMLRGTELDVVLRSQTDLLERGVPADLARTISESLYAYSLLDIVDTAHAYDEAPARLADVYFELSAHLGVDDLLLAVSGLPRAGRWHSLARLALREDLYRSLRDVALDVCRRLGEESGDVLEEFEAYNAARIERARRTLTEFLGAENRDLAAVSVATAQLRRLTTLS